MDTANLRTSLAGLAAAVLGRDQDYRQLITVPQCFVFLVLLVIEALTARTSINLLLTRIAGILSILLFDLIAIQARLKFTAVLVIAELTVLILALSTATVFLGVMPGFGVLLPIALVFISLVSLRLPWQLSGIFAAVVSGVCGISLLAVPVPRVEEAAVRGGFLLMTAMAWVVFFCSLLLRGIKVPDAASSQSARDGFDAQKITANNLGIEDDIQRERLQRLYNRLSVEEFLSECAARLPFLSSILAAAVLLEIVQDRADLSQFRASWLTIALVQFGLMVLLFLCKNLHRLQLYALLVSAVGLLWIWLFTAVSSSSLASFLLFIFSVIAFGSLPWSFSVGLAFAGVAATVLIAAGLLGVWPPVHCALGSLVILIAFRGCVTQHLNLMTRINATFFARCCEFSPSVQLTVKMLVGQLGILTGSDKILVCFGAQRALRVERENWRPSHADNLYLRGILKKVDDTHRQEGVLAYSELGEQFVPALREWFGSVPAKLIFVKLPAIIEEEEIEIVVIVPAGAPTLLAGLNKVFRGIAGIASIARLSLAMARSRFLSSDVLLATERSASEREQELNRVIHNVNNAAQEIAIHCTQAKRALSDDNGKDPQADSEEQRRGLLAGLEKMEAAARALSAGTSDVKLLNELTRVKEFRHVENIEVQSLIEEADGYGRYLTYRKGQEFSVENSTSTSSAVAVVSREFLEAVLRLFLRVASSNVGKGGRVSLVAMQEGDIICFEVQDNGEAIDELVKVKVTGATKDNQAYTSKDDVFSLRAAANLARLSNGKFEFRAANEGAVNRMALLLPKAEFSKETSVIPGQWALLVDDNAEVTTFYSRVAEALGFRYFTAASVEEAQSIIETHGKPRLVITDIQLGEGSGLDLVRTLRKQFGNELPVIVVSGNNDTLIEENVRGAGATKFLAKPVGRRKLFAEIQGIL